MFYYNLKFIALLLLFYLLLPFPSDQTVEVYPIDDEGLLAFVRGPTKFEEFCQGKGMTNQQAMHFLAQSYGTTIGIFNLMRQNWHCDKVDDQSEQKRCLAHRKYLNKYYEYLFKVNDVPRNIKEPREQISKKQFFIHNKLLNEMKNFLALSKYYFCEPKLVLKEHFIKAYILIEQFGSKQVMGGNYVHKSKSGQITEKPKESENDRKKFDQIMQKMVTKTLEEIGRLEKDTKTMEMPSSSAQQMPLEQENAAPKCVFDLDFPLFYEMAEALEEEAFLAFVKGTKDFTVHFTRQLQEGVEFLANEPNIEKLEHPLGLLYLMKKSWDFKAKMDNCKTLQRYVNIIYEYVLKVRHGISAVRPMFGERATREMNATFDVFKPRHRIIIRNLNTILIALHNLSIGTNKISEIELLNETELEENTSSEILEISKISFEEYTVKMAQEICDRRNGKQISATEMEGLLRHEFDKYLQEILEKGLEF